MRINGVPYLSDVSTHSRAEAAAKRIGADKVAWLVSTHSRAEAAACSSSAKRGDGSVSTHSRAEAAA